MSERRPVRALSVDVARKIAAGEVIDRPAAIVRELLDNAVDSGADSINVEIAGGGIEKIRIADNGAGMTLDDLKNCARPHCTSKIAESEDLLNLTTLGFRGEALASIAAVARLSIMSGTNKMRASITEDHLIETIPPVQDGKGTIVMSEGLFENFPARRNFLKRPSSETMMCREVFIEKSLTAVFDCLHQGIFLSAATVYENVDLLSVVSVDAWFSNYKRIAPVGCSVIFLSA